MALSQSQAVATSGPIGKTLTDTLSAILGGVGSLVSLTPNGGRSLQAQTQAGATKQEQPPDGTPIAAPGEGLGVDALVKDKGEAGPAPGLFNTIPRWVYLAAGVGAVLLLLKVGRK